MTRETNKTTEMPVEIWVRGTTWCKEKNPLKLSPPPPEVPYIRKDTIPNKSDVARELHTDINWRAGEKIYRGAKADVAFYDAMIEVLKEWEDGEK